MKGIKKLKKCLMIMLTLMVAFTVVSSNITFAMTNNDTEEIEETDAEARAGLKDLDGEDIKYPDKLINIADDKNRYVENSGNIIPITDWKRSDVSNNEYVIRGISGYNAKDWMWSEVQDIGLSVTDQEKVWDGSRKASHVARNGSYLSENQITAMNGNLYDSLTWDNKGKNNQKVTIHRLQGKFRLPEIDKDYEPNDYTYTIKQITPDSGNRIYINDNIYVFIYPDPEEADAVKITDENFMQHLAFWTGTTQNTNKVTEFNGRKNTTAFHNSREGLGTLTDGWNTIASVDNASNSILRYYNSLGIKNYVVDIFVEDYDQSGGTYRFEIEQRRTTRYDVQFRKVDERDIHKGLPGASFELIEKDTLVPYYADSDENGFVNFKVLPGNYTLKETKAPDGYKSVNETWDIKVSNDGRITYDNDIQFGSMYNGEKYSYITNEKDIVGNFTLVKANSNNEPLAGAEFTLYEKNGNDVIKTIETGSDGIISFTNIPVGDYVLKETKAPSGYVESEEFWNISVDYEGNVKITNSKNQQVQDRSYITNYTEEEILVKDIEKDKKIIRHDYNNREYTIDLTASSNAKTEGTEAQSASVVLVLDRSSSMKSSLDKLKSAAIGFIKELATKSKNSEVAVVPFSNNATSNKGGLLTLSSDRNKNTLINVINQMSASGGTSMDEGLEKASDLLETSENEHKYVVFFTDGLPGYWEDDNEKNHNVAWGAKEAANALKNNNTEIYAVGFSNALNNKFRWCPNREDYNYQYSKTMSGKEFLSGYIASEGKYSSSDDSNLEQIFKDIAGEISTSIPIQANKIVDVIDPRFELTTESEAALIDKWGEDNVQIVKNDDGSTTIIWTGEAALIKAKENNTPGWREIITIKAKDDFIGGNKIPTNGQGSGIYVGEDGKVDVSFPKPTANVKLLELAGGSKTTTVFIEDVIDVKEVVGKLKDVFEIDNLLIGTKFPLPNDCILTDNDVAALLKGDIVNKDYSYPGTNNDVVGTISYKLVDSDYKEDHLATEVGTPLESYRIQIEYSPKALDQRDDILEDSSYLNPIGDKNSESIVGAGISVVNVVAGRIVISKNIDKAGIENLHGAPVFTFKIVRHYNGVSDTYYRTIKFTGKGQLFAEELKNLPRGSYTITELDTQRYSFNKVISYKDGDIQGTPDNDTKSITFDIGVGNNKDNYDQLTGSALFYNKRTGNSGKRTDTDVVLNRFIKKADGSWEVKQIEEPQSPNRSYENKGIIDAAFDKFKKFFGIN